MDYTDDLTGKMLTAEPGRSYDIRATWDLLPVPPADGFWGMTEEQQDPPDPPDTGPAPEEEPAQSAEPPAQEEE